MKRNPGAVFVLRLFRETRITAHLAARGLLPCLVRRALSRPVEVRGCGIISWQLPWAGVFGPDEFKALLEKSIIRYIEGYHTIYVPPQPQLDEVLCEAARFYPPGAGFKFLKDFRPPAQASYPYGFEFWVKRKLTGRPIDQVGAANALHLLGLGPRIYDLAMFTTPSSRLTCFVVEHVEGRRPTLEEHALFIRALQALISEGILELVPWEGLGHEDFAGPSCNGNLIVARDGGRPLYIDFQQMVLRSRDRLLACVLGNTGRSSPSWAAGAAELKALLADEDVSMHGRLVLAFGEAAAALVGQALSLGSPWGLVWVPSEARIGTQAHHLVGGCTRLSFAETHPWRLKEAIPPHLDRWVRGAVAIVSMDWCERLQEQSLGEIPWEVLVLVAGPGDEGSDFAVRVERTCSTWGCARRAERGCPRGRLALLVRPSRRG